MTIEVLNDSGTYSGEDLQNAINANPGGTISVAGTYVIEKPLRIASSNTKLIGRGKAVLKTANTFAGHMIGVGPEEGAPELGPSLIPGPGNALRVYNNKSALINLREAARVDFNGLIRANKQNFCFELVFKLETAANPQAARYITSCSGRRAFGEPYSITLQIYTWSSGMITAKLRTTNGTTTISSPVNTVLPGNVYHMALDYEGTTLRLWINGALAASAPCSGNIVQEVHETWSIGTVPAFWPDSTGPISGAIDGWIDALRIGPSRYTAPFSPPTVKHSPGSLIDLVCNFEVEPISPMYIKAYSWSNINVWLQYKRSLVLVPGLLIGGTQIEGFEFQQGEGSLGLCAWRSIEMVVKHLMLSGGRIGASLRDNCFLSQISNIRATMGGPTVQFVLGVLDAAGVTQVDQLSIVAGTYGLVATTSIDLRNSFIHGSGNFSYLLRGATPSTSFNLNSVFSSDEDKVLPSEGVMMVSNGNLRLAGGALERVVHARQLVHLDRVSGICDATTFRSKIGAGPIFHEFGGANNFKVRQPVIEPSNHILSDGSGVVLV